MYVSRALSSGIIFFLLPLLCLLFVKYLCYVSLLRIFVTYLCYVSLSSIFILSIFVTHYNLQLICDHVMLFMGLFSVNAISTTALAVDMSRNCI